MPPRITSPSPKPATGSLNTATNTTGLTDVGSACAGAWSMATDGGVTSPAGRLNVTVLSVLVDAWFGLFARSTQTMAPIEAVTVPVWVMPDTVTVYEVGPPLTTAVVAPAVPPRVTSPVAKPLTASLNTTSNTIDGLPVGSACEAPWLMVTVGGVTSPAGWLYCTELSVLVEARLAFVARSWATPAARDAVTVPGWVMPDTCTVNVVGPPLTTAVVAPAVPPRVTSPVAKPVTGSENTTSNTIGLTEVGSACEPPWSMVTIGGVLSTSGWLYCTVASPDEDARLALVAPSWAMPAARLAVTVPVWVMPETCTV